VGRHSATHATSTWMDFIPHPPNVIGMAHKAGRDLKGSQGEGSRAGWRALRTTTVMVMATVCEGWNAGMERCMSEEGLGAERRVREGTQRRVVAQKSIFRRLPYHHTPHTYGGCQVASQSWRTATRRVKKSRGRAYGTRGNAGKDGSTPSLQVVRRNKLTQEGVSQDHSRVQRKTTSLGALDLTLQLFQHASHLTTSMPMVLSFGDANKSAI
jgi:hypothetical protein